ncbi:MAG: nucleotide sugar dehydrogenase [candidate division NC10 bacterium]|nr:nucleotide sugar dehydrogenase [candidate division NC10 bacterium]
MNPMNPPSVECVGIIGLGYVGLSLATAFGRVLPTVGFDIDHARIRELQAGHDRTGEMRSESLKAPQLVLTADPEGLRRADFLIVTVPTPVDQAKRPDLSHLIDASRLIGRILRDRGSTSNVQRSTSKPNKPNEPNKPIIVYESTVYPGCTEEVCIPVVEQESGRKAGTDFTVGYSPERINPGDPEHTLETIVKVVAGQDRETAQTMAEVYGRVVKAGVYTAPDIKTAEAAKVIENIQRDLNIAFMNELSLLFHRLDIDMREVLKAARTKWNFLPFEPGLVGGHCIPVDPYYLTHKAQEAGFHPEVILAGRRINDSMGVYVAQETIKLLIKAGRSVRGAQVLVLGVTFKENVRDVRNTRVVELVRELENYGVAVSVHDPLIGVEDLQKLSLHPAPDPFQFREHRTLNLEPPETLTPLTPQPPQPNKPNKPNEPNEPQYDALILAVPHRVFREKSPEEYLALLKTDAGSGVLVDVKGVLPGAIVEQAGALYWSL